MAKILVTDDSSSTRSAVSEALRERGHEITEAANGSEALKALETDMPDGIILDLLMPEMDGVTALREIRRLGLQVPVIILTADIQDTTRDIVEGLGVRAFINKPIRDLKKFAADIESALERKQLW